ncbi:hypothetical protein D779_3504 [Imhoffiella purpurea]|uniref:Uncharacterized protein n=1 Tax=Imhoffiella purpurea TaxID=1249627 RepID=W9VC48_9GAMM|nr:hypothetical protein D779_3504 [Imhoffiella purpurea]
MAAPGRHGMRALTTVTGGMGILQWWIAAGERAQHVRRRSRRSWRRKRRAFARRPVPDRLDQAAASLGEPSM